MRMKITFSPRYSTTIFTVLTLIEHTRMFFLHNKNEMVTFWLCNTIVGEEGIKSGVEYCNLSLFLNPDSVKCRNFVADQVSCNAHHFFVVWRLFKVSSCPFPVFGWYVPTHIENVGKPGSLLSKDEANGPHESYHWRPFLQVNTSVTTIIKLCLIEVLYFVVRAPVNRRIILLFFIFRYNLTNELFEKNICFICPIKNKNFEIKEIHLLSTSHDLF